VKRFTSFEEIEILCEAMIKDFFRSKHYTNVLCVDIETFVRDYLGMPIVYESFAEPDPGRVGFYADGVRPLMVKRADKTEEIVYPARTVVIDKFLQSPQESARKRFTIAHEGAHDVLERHGTGQMNAVAAFHSEYDPDMTYSGDMLREMLSMNECCTNRAGACLLMPGFLVNRVMKRYNAENGVVMYQTDEGVVLSKDQRVLIQKMANTMGASYTAFYYRLQELGRFDIRPMEEYLHAGLCYGGLEPCRQ